MNKHVRNILFFFLFSLASVISIMIYRLGFFKDVKLERVSGKSFQLLYKQHLGPYHKVIDDLKFVENWAKKNKVKCETTFGEYLDNPDNTAPERLRANVGCLVKSKPLVELTDNLKFKIHSHSAFVKATFLGSPAIGPLKVYPKANEWAQKNKVQFERGVIEVYLPKNDEMLTEFYFPIQ